ncbi:host RecBCD nuclease inhibitor [Sinorhizobium phage phiM9]|uniref:Uncharacterized protein n=1 Tax=Sinorhizobium phage phiM9 TaxID=1636182 RepID=A0A0F6TGQ2_9CAUD|nr:host RecBCD nuclease inhibitor [Sinorhizobium phage phiM9]AKE44824.1 hypothetical protein Sm_phiM9_197 [Sinorhizobium phage phiM9]
MTEEVTTGKLNGDNLLILSGSLNLNDIVYRGDYVDRAVLLPAVDSILHQSFQDSRNTCTVTIPQEEYQQLLADQAELNGLKARGVDNWEGYGDA